MKFKLFGEQSVLVGMVHNSKDGSTLIKEILQRRHFDCYLIELNKTNFGFIKKNKFILSEFYPFVNIPNEKVVLLDKELRQEIEEQGVITYQSYIKYKLDKLFFYKTMDGLTTLGLNSNLIKNSITFKEIYDKHITKREEHMGRIVLSHLKKNKSIFVLVGWNHFDYISTLL